MPGRLSRKRPASGTFDDRNPQADLSEHDSTNGELEATASDGEGEDNVDGATSQDDLVKKLVRLALAHESQRRPLRRQDIGDKVLANAGRQFKKVFAQAQDELRTIFGMELVELPAREKLTVAQRRAAQQKTTASKTPTAAWVLTTVLPLAHRNANILQPGVSETDSEYAGLYSILVTLIALNGGIVAETRLDRYLNRLRLSETTPLRGFEKTEQLLKRMERDGYIVKIRERIGVSGEEEISWALGSRGKVEVGRAGITGLVETVYAPEDDVAASELAKKLERSLEASLGHINTPPLVESQPAARTNRRRPRSTQADEGHEEG